MAVAGKGEPPAGESGRGRGAGEDHGQESMVGLLVVVSRLRGLPLSVPFLLFF